MIGHTQATEEGPGGNFLEKQQLRREQGVNSGSLTL